MRQARILTPEGPVSGRYENGTIHAADGTYEVGVDGRLLPPCDPTALYCVGRNYAETIDQMDYERPAAPDFFIKPPTSLIAHGEAIPEPAWTDELTYAGELVAVIGRRCRGLDPADVPDVVRGYTILNDVDALDQVGRTARKAFDGSAPLGPWIETDLDDPTDVEMETIVSGERRQSATTAQMLFDPFEIVAHLSERFTLRPGDCVAFGSPANPGLIESGDTVSITYEGVGTLENTVVDGEFP
ncbi:2-keto-4-pentenoate hydratase/2-oxohepta-3-ene-1,7-dioic acid hydratase (catechol pathway) [Halopenitus malekzadehii]|uniref:2-keto-4-pentenoate hydratase/2-oxohepta-3-ene-1,7-dioic acid hydratase (Catechol pathway) n=1 Tax=Halopenitus malekzadehii TaxID=1267564 RepID=A0A1H6IHV7_9EURY|nr:fumarylacetoacetate hydrolase family protein [Halopenitus malekzadehii]SEH46094.1 2-keto-4-pentenoate hydratase/2-oxohepta-3-ene-1,7-dioic acid hydratase (catechol pathway) [Halopenitus malekzadehii]